MHFRVEHLCASNLHRAIAYQWGHNFDADVRCCPRLQWLDNVCRSSCGEWCRSYHGNLQPYRGPNCPTVPATDLYGYTSSHDVNSNHCQAIVYSERRPDASPHDGCALCRSVRAAHGQPHDGCGSKHAAPHGAPHGAYAGALSAADAGAHVCGVLRPVPRLEHEL